MLKLFFKCLLFCNGIFSLNSAIALPLADSLDVSSVFETRVELIKSANNGQLTHLSSKYSYRKLPNNVKQLSCIFNPTNLTSETVIDEDFLGVFYSINNISHAKFQAYIDHLLVAHYTNINLIALNVADSFRRRHFIENPFNIGSYLVA
jgi:hypothetical protein